MADLKEVQASLERMQSFDPNSLPREGDLGRQINFLDVEAPAKKLIGLYLQLSVNSLSDLGDQQLDQLSKIANADFNRFKEVLEFDLTAENATGRRDQISQQIRDSYQNTFNVLYPLIAYGMTRAVDFQRMENEARSTIQGIKDQAIGVTEALDASQTQAEQILDEIRRVAAEQGVSQQASYFKKEAEKHEKLSNEWRSRTVKIASLLGTYSILAIFLHKIPWLAPTDGYQAVQLITAKVLLFGVIGYMLILSARNFLSHEHNTIVNTHRQNALMTYTALVDAAKDEDSSDIVLLHAAQCIFTPQETGYAKQENSRNPAVPVLDMLRRSAIGSGSQ